jgi:hypothetical protein
LTGIDDEWDKRFDHVVRSEQDPSHAEKLDHLAELVLGLSTNANDWMIFLDGDAFPIAPVCTSVTEYLSKAPLVAVQRLENVGDIQPHPCFCATTTGFWRTYRPTWKEGFEWKNALGATTTDVGAGVLEVLESHEMDWIKLHRSNMQDLHPVLFGIYSDLIYHHGAGYRDGGLTRQDYVDYLRPARMNLYGRVLLRLIPTAYKDSVLYSRMHPFGRVHRRLKNESIALSQNVYQKILRDPDTFFRTLRSKRTNIIPG